MVFLFVQLNRAFDSSGERGDVAPSFPIGNYSVDLTWYFHQKDVVGVQLPRNPLRFSTVVVSAVLRQTGLGVCSEDIRHYFQQHVLTEEHGVCFDEQKHAVLAPW